MSALRLTDRPPLPGMPPPGQIVYVNNRVRHSCRCHGPQHIRETIEREVAQIHLLISRFATLAMTGSMQIVVLTTTYQLAGELTSYHRPTGEGRNALLREIDQRVYYLKDTYGQYLDRVEFSLEQGFNPNFRPAQVTGGLRRELRLHEYAQLAVGQGAKCFHCRRPSQVEDLRHWGPHDSGWRVSGFDEKQWLVMKCPSCRYETSFAKLEIARPVPSAT